MMNASCNWVDLFRSVRPLRRFLGDILWCISAVPVTWYRVVVEVAHGDRVAHERVVHRLRCLRRVQKLVFIVQILSDHLTWWKNNQSHHCLKLISIFAARCYTSVVYAITLWSPLCPSVYRKPLLYMERDERIKPVFGTEATLGLSYTMLCGNSGIFENKAPLKLRPYGAIQICLLLWLLSLYY